MQKGAIEVFTALKKVVFKCESLRVELTHRQLPSIITFAHCLPKQIYFFQSKVKYNKVILNTLLFSDSGQWILQTGTTFPH